MFVNDPDRTSRSLSSASPRPFPFGEGNEMTDAMDKQFQQDLHLSRGQSAWVRARKASAFIVSATLGAAERPKLIKDDRHAK